jgi:hypothetical protein
MNDFIDKLRAEQIKAEKNAGEGGILKVRKARRAHKHDPTGKKQMKRLDFDADFGDGDQRDGEAEGASDAEEMDEEKKVQISRLAAMLGGYAKRFEQELEKGLETAAERRAKAAIERQKAAR